MSEDFSTAEEPGHEGVEELDGDPVAYFTRDAAEGLAPIHTLLMQNQAAEVVFVTPDFKLEGLEDGLVLAALPLGALGARRGSDRGPLVLRAKVTVEAVSALDGDTAEPYLLECDVAVFTEAVYQSILGAEDVEETQVGFVFATSAGLQVNPLVGSVNAVCPEAALAARRKSKRIAVPLGAVKPRRGAKAAGSSTVPTRSAQGAEPTARSVQPGVPAAEVQPNHFGTSVGALEASGVDPESARMIMEVLRDSRTQMRDPATSYAKAPPVELVDRAETEADEVAEPANGSSELAAALTKLAAALEDMKPKPKTGLEAMLSTLGSPDTSTSSSTPQVSRRNAAVRLALRSALQDQPMYFVNHIESAINRRVREIIRTPDASSGSGSAEVPYRAYVEHRAWLSTHRPTQYWAWILAGIGQALSGGRVEEARARTGLGLLFAEQLSMDAGQMSFAAELLMEDPPPAISAKQPEAGTAIWPAPCADAWAEVILHHLRDRMTFEQHRATTLRRRRPGGPPPGLDAIDAPSAENTESRRRPNPKAKPKADPK